MPDGNAGVVSATRTGDAVEPLLSGQDWVGGLAVEEDRVYVAASTVTEGTRILELSLDGGVRTVATVAGAVEDVIMHDGFVYWTRPLACAVVRASLDVDGRTEAIATDQNVPSRLFVDERGIVWTNAGRAGNGYEGSHVVASDTDGSNQVTLAAGRNAYALAVDGDAVFFTNNELDGEVAATVR